MKTTQELAEDLTKVIIDNWAKSKAPLKLHIQNSIPLLELLEVARAAILVQEVRTIDPCDPSRIINPLPCANRTIQEVTNAHTSLGKAISALKSRLQDL